MNKCLEKLLADSRSCCTSCSVAKKYVGCIVRAQQLHLIVMSHEDIFRKEWELRGILIRLHMFCQIDLEEIIIKLRNHQTQKQPPPPRKPQPPPPTHLPSPPTNQPSISSATESPSSSIIQRPTRKPLHTGCEQEMGFDCYSLPNGDFPIPSPLCQLGQYVTCSNGNSYIRECIVGYYGEPGSFFPGKLVFDPESRRCERKTPSCKRCMDSKIYSRK